MNDLEITIQTEEETHVCIQENRGDEIWMYCPICEVYVRKFDSKLRPIKLIDTEFNHTGTIRLGYQINMN